LDRVGVFFTLVSVGQPIPVWLGLAWPFMTLPWVFLFLKGGGWAWVQQRVPEQMKIPDTRPGTPKKKRKKVDKGKIY